MLPEGDKNCDVRNKCVRLFEKYSGDELQLKIAEAIADEWLEMYRYKPFNEPKPKIAVTYMAMEDSERKRFDKENPEWEKSEEMQKYAWKEQAHVRTMASHKDFLQTATHYLEQDVPRRTKIQGVLAGYPQTKVRLEQPTASWED